MIDFHAGQKVICVADERWLRDQPFLVRGNIYTVASIEPPIAPFGFGLRIEEFVTDPITLLPAIFWANRFRPLETKAIQLFRNIAANPNVEISDDELERVGNGWGLR